MERNVAHAEIAPDGSVRPQPLSEHLHSVAARATAHAAAFGSAPHAHLAGLWHDLGKYQPTWQAYLWRAVEGAEKARGPEHAGAGAALASRHREQLLAVAFAIAGHHAGLANLHTSTGGLTPLAERIRSNETRLDEALKHAPRELVDLPIPEYPAFVAKAMRRFNADEGAKRTYEFWTRMLFSALVDADRLDAEAFSNPDAAASRAAFPELIELKERLDDHLARKVAALDSEVGARPINRARAEILDACRAAADCAPGFFSLTVPTGGGKTLSAMAFALAHANRHGLRRVFVVIPFTSIIEQNAQAYREALGADAVIEHHSALDADSNGATESEWRKRQDRAAENWDAPVIATTTVRFFEGLLSNRPSECRRLHNIAASVVILDEVQSLPPKFLLPILDVLKELVAHYGCTVLLATATPPALRKRPQFDFGLPEVREIAPDPFGLARALRRVRYHWPAPDAPPLEWPALAAALLEHPRVLCVVHRRADARELAERLAIADPDMPLVHLSALMCPAHRLACIKRVKAMAPDAPCRVVSTQLIEAGVDLDFPVVYRAMGGLDSIVQAGGRCNREGRSECGDVHVFQALSDPPRGLPQTALQTALELLSEHGSSLDPAQPDIIDDYFRALYHARTLDGSGIQAMRQGFNFADVAAAFRLIEDGFTQTVVVPYGNAPRLLERLRRDGPSRDLMRALQPYGVSIYDRSFFRLLNTGALDEVYTGTYTLTAPYEHLYSEAYGLFDGDETPPADPGALLA